MARQLVLGVHLPIGAASIRGGLPPENVEIEAHGNVLTAISFLHGLAEELRKGELEGRPRL